MNHLSRRPILFATRRMLWARTEVPAGSSVATRSYSGTSRQLFDDSDDDSMMHQRPQTALVVGSSGSLGKTLTKYLSKELGVRVIGADVVEPLSKDETHLKGGFVELPTVLVPETEHTEPAPLQDLTMALTDGLHELLGTTQKLDAVICVAGAWEGDAPGLPPLEELPHDDDEVDLDEDTTRRLWLAEGARAYAHTIDNMMGKNLYPVLAAGYASQHFMKTGGSQSQQQQDEYGEYYYEDGGDDDDGGLFVAIGATIALGGGTPGMLGYGLSKVATHHFVQTLGESTGNAVTSKSKRKATRSMRLEHPYLQHLSVIGILPTTIDTHANRTAMPDANYAEWTKSIDIAKEIGTWIREPSLRPHSGSLLKVHPKKNGEGAEFQLAR